MMILLGHDNAVADWVGKINGKPFHEPYKAIGILDGEGTLTGGYVFTGFNGDGVEVSIAGRGCISRSACSAMLSYVFDQLGCSRLQMHTRRSNKALRKLAPRLGFHHEGVARKFYGNEDGLLFSLTTNDLSAFRAKWRI